MGTACSKSKKKEGVSTDDQYVFDPRLIYFDANGNLRYGIPHIEIWLLY